MSGFVVFLLVFVVFVVFVGFRFGWSEQSMAPGIVDLLVLLAKCQDLLFLFYLYLLNLLFLLVSGLAG